MRLSCPPARLDALPIHAVTLNLNCRDEIIPLLHALQHVYGNPLLRTEILRLVGKDVNSDTSPMHGRRGMNYWEITVLAAARLGCNLDYDKLQELAENHRTLRQMMGLGDWQEEEVDFDWRRIENNVSKLRPETLQQINERVVQAGHALQPQAIQAVRGDTFVVETNIHYPTESSLIGDGLRKILPLAAALAEVNGQEGWRQHEQWRKKVRQLVRKINRAARAKGRNAERLKLGYQQLWELTEELLRRARRLLQALAFPIDTVPASLEQLKNAAAATTREGLLVPFVRLTEYVCHNARRRVIAGETLTNDEKLFSIFEPHTELMIRGKQPNPTQFGHRVLIVEDAVGLVVDYQVVKDGVLDQDLVMPVMKKLQERYHGKIQSASFDRGFHTPDNQKALAELVETPCIAAKGEKQGRQQHQEGGVAFRQARQHHPGVESVIGALQSGNGQKRCRDRGKRGYERYVGLGILGRNLQTLGKLLLGQEQANCQAAKSKRKHKVG
jgi:transposase, IS5 family